MNRRTARTIRAAVKQAKFDHQFLMLFVPELWRTRILRSLLRNGGPSSTIGGNAYAVALTRLTRKGK